MVEKVFLENVFKGFDSADTLRPNTVITDIELVKRDLTNHFQTRRGERVMRPEFGSIIWDMLFEPFTELVRDAIISDVERIVESDSRVEIMEIDVLDFEQGIRVDVGLYFKPFEVQDTFSVGFDRRNAVDAVSDFDDTF